MAYFFFPTVSYSMPIICSSYTNNKFLKTWVMLNCSVLCFRPPSNEVSHSSFEPFRYKFYARSPFQCQLFAQRVVNTHKYIWIANSFNTSCMENHQTQPKVLFINLWGSTFLSQQRLKIYHYFYNICLKVFLVSRCKFSLVL